MGQKEVAGEKLCVAPFIRHCQRSFAQESDMGTLVGLLGEIPSAIERIRDLSVSPRARFFHGAVCCALGGATVFGTIALMEFFRSGGVLGINLDIPQTDQMIWRFREMWTGNETVQRFVPVALGDVVTSKSPSSGGNECGRNSEPEIYAWGSWEETDPDSMDLPHVLLGIHSQDCHTAKEWAKDNAKRFGLTHIRDENLNVRGYSHTRAVLKDSDGDLWESTQIRYDDGTTRPEIRKYGNIER